ncbi:MAG: hypothetical protein ACP5DX_01825 [Paracoccaceae bacterium]
MRNLFMIAVLLAASAFARTEPGRPDSVMLSRDRVVVGMSTGRRCLGLRAAGEPTGTGWAGRLQGCAADYPYEVVLQEGANPLRLMLEAAFEALGGDGLLAPRARVEITGPEGRVWRFRAPGSEEPRAGSAER